MRALAGLAAVAAVAISGCAASGGGVASDAPLAVYLSVPLSGPDASRGEAIAAGAKRALATPAARPAATRSSYRCSTTAVARRRRGVNARTANEDASTIAYIGDLDEPATRTSLPITDLANIPQIVLGPVPGGLDVANLIDAPSVHGDDAGAAAVELLLTAIEKAGSDGGDRKQVRDELKTAAADQI